MGCGLRSPRVGAASCRCALRQTLIASTHRTRQVTEGQQTKMEMIYSYLTGPRFRQRVEAIVEAFSNDEGRPRQRAVKSLRNSGPSATRKSDRVMQATVGMYGDMQGIAGKSLQEIEGLGTEGVDRWQ